MKRERIHAIVALSNSKQNAVTETDCCAASGPTQTETPADTGKQPIRSCNADDRVAATSVFRLGET